MIKDQLIYVAHPFGGNKENKSSIDTIMKNLVMLDKNNTYLSPLHNFSMVYFADEYAKGVSVQQISTQSGYSITWVRSLLAGAGVELRE